MGVQDTTGTIETNEYEVTIEPRVAVVGVGGAGCNVVSDLYMSCIAADTIGINTDKTALMNCNADQKLYICKAVTQGEGARGDAGLGRKCAKVHEDEIENALRGHDIVFVVAGMGGGTGSGAAAVVAEIAQRLNIMTFAIAINPFFFENTRTTNARIGLSHLEAVCPLTVVVENNKVLEQLPDATMPEAFKTVNAGIADFIRKQTARIADTFVDELNNMKFDDSNENTPSDLRIRFGMKA